MRDQNFYFSNIISLLLLKLRKEYKVLLGPTYKDFYHTETVPRPTSMLLLGYWGRILLYGQIEFYEVAGSFSFYWDYCLKYNQILRWFSHLKNYHETNFSVENNYIRFKGLSVSELILPKVYWVWWLNNFFCFLILLSTTRKICNHSRNYAKQIYGIFRFFFSLVSFQLAF